MDDNTSIHEDFIKILAKPRSLGDQLQNLESQLVALKLKVSPSTFSRIIKKQSSISPEMALRLSKCLGRSPESWLRMQDSFDLWQAKQSLDISEIEPLAMPA